MEARQAAQAVKLVQTTSNMIRSPIEYALLFTRTNAAFQTADEREVRQEMEMNSISLLPVRRRACVLISVPPGTATRAHLWPLPITGALR